MKFIKIYNEFFNLEMIRHIYFGSNIIGVKTYFINFDDKQIQIKNKEDFETIKSDITTIAKQKRNDYGDDNGKI